MPRMWWPGTRVESIHDYVGVLVPLDEAHLHGHSARCGRTEFEDAPDDDASSDHDDAPKDPDDEGAGMLEMSAAEYSIEGLRREVRSGEKGKTWTEYESTKTPPDSALVEATLPIAAILTARRSEVEAYQQSHSRHRHGEV